MRILTRYRDLPFSEVRSCAIPAVINAESERGWEEKQRGKPIEFLSGPVPKNETNACDGPFYLTTKPHPKSGFYLLCPHIAEIGD